MCISNHRISSLLLFYSTSAGTTQEMSHDGVTVSPLGGPRCMYPTPPLDKLSLSPPPPLLVHTNPSKGRLPDGPWKGNTSLVQNRDKTKINMGMGGRATSTHRLMVDSARIRTVFVRETPNVSRRHTCKTETKPRSTWEWAGGQLPLTY